MIIGLLGFPFNDANMGCVALTCSYIEILRELFGNDLEIVNLSQDDLPEYVTSHFSNVKFSYGKIKIKDIKRETIRNFKKCDYICDITFGDNFSDIYSFKFVLKTTIFKEFAIMSGTPLILAPQTYGPFESKILERFAAHVIRKSSRVYTRDQLSAEYVKKICGIQPIVVTDLAFALPYNKKEFSANKTKVGINVSGLLWRSGFTDNSCFAKVLVDYKQYIKKLIERLLLIEDYEIHLIPHVIASDNSTIDDDVNECVSLHVEYPDTILAPAFITPIEAKSYIAGMDVFTGARMHSTVAAFSSGVPTIPFAYSRKFQGLYDNLRYPYIIDGTKLTTDKAVNTTLLYIEQRDMLRKVQEKSMIYIFEKLNIFKEDLRRVIKNK